jgi:hypothetical protein
MATWIAIQVKKLYRVNGTIAWDVGPARSDRPPTNGQMINFEIGADRVTAMICEEPQKINAAVFEVVAKEIKE